MTKDEVLKLFEQGKGAMPSHGYLDYYEKALLLAFLFDEQDAPIDWMEAPEDSTNPVEVPYVSTGYHRWLDHEGYPMVKPPWGTLTAIDLNKGEILWQVPLGEFEELTNRGISPTGTENYGGPVATAGGLVFIAATKDEKFRAFNKATGEVLWETRLPAGGHATPATYEYAGKQYVVIAAGGNKMGTKPGDSYVAFTLPD